MNLHPTIVKGLSSGDIQFVVDAVEFVNDYLLDELAEKRCGGEQTEGGPFSSFFLPHRHRHLYDSKVIQRLYVCFVVVTGRLEDGWSTHTCRAEELVTAAIIEQAKLLCEDATGSASPALDDLYDTLFEDLDHEFMFDPSFDGIDDSDTFAGAQLNTGPLHPSTWFEPLWDGDRVHPLASG